MFYARHLMVLAALLVSSAPALAQAWWDTSWTRRRQLTFQNGSGAEDLPDFPVLVKLDSTRVDYGQTQDLGQDLRFVDADGSTVLEYEIETWDEGGESFVWVKVPQVDAGSASDHIWMYYGNGTASPGQQPANVWTSSYEAVYHFNGGTDDSTSNNNDATDTATGSTAGVVAGARTFDGTGAHVETPFLIDPASTDLTGTAWVYLRAESPTSNPSMIISQQDGSGVGRIWFGRRHSSYVADPQAVYTYLGGSAMDSSQQLAEGVWRLLTVTVVSGTIRLYIDQTEVATATKTMEFCDGPFYFGRHKNDSNPRYWDGHMDEVRIASSARSPAWVIAQHSSMTDAFVDHGSEEIYAPPSPPGAFDLLTPTSGSTTTDLEPTLDWGDSSNVQTYRLRVDDDANFTSTIIDDASLTSSSHTIGPGMLAADTTYYWRVSATNTQGTVNATNNDFSFTTPSRVTSGLVVLYEFEEGSGATIHDTSGYGTPLDLTIEDTGNVTWQANYLSVDSETRIGSSGAATKVTTACSASNEVTVEAWLDVADLTQNGPARIVTISDGAYDRNITLGQEADEINVRLRTTITNDNGTTYEIATAGNVLANALAHVVFTRRSNGNTAIYVDGASVYTGNIGGNLSAWDSGYGFALANEIGASREWLGELHLVAIYDRALDSSEVATNYAAGPGPFAGPTPPGAFILQQPANTTTIATLQPTLEWSASTDATSYSLRLDNNSDFSSPIVDVTGLALTTYPVGAGDLAWGDTYFWQVVATNAAGSTDASNNDFEFTTQQVVTPPGAFSLLDPADAATDVSQTTTLSWGTSADVVTYALLVDDEVAFASPEVNESALTANSFDIPAGVLSPETSYYWQVVAINSAGATDAANNPFTFTTGRGLPPPWVDDVLGAPTVTGGASYSDGEFSVNAAGADIFFGEDEGHFVYQAVSGNCEITARLASHDLAAGNAKAGVMIRSALDAGSRRAATLLENNNGILLHWRETDDGYAELTRDAYNTYAAPYWLRLQRLGDSFTAYASPTPRSWEVISRVDVSMGTDVLIGMAVSSLEPDTARTAVFDNVTVILAPGAFSLVSPAASASDVELALALDWTDSPYAQTYSLEVDDDADFSSPLVDVSSLTDSTYGVPEGVLDEEATYYWRVTAHNSLGSVPADNNGAAFTTERATALGYLGGGCLASGQSLPAGCLQALLAGILLLAATRRIRGPASEEGRNQ